MRSGFGAAVCSALTATREIARPIHLMFKSHLHKWNRAAPKVGNAETFNHAALDTLALELAPEAPEALADGVNSEAFELAALDWEAGAAIDNG